MRPSAPVAHRRIHGLVVGCTLFALACGGTKTSSPQAGMGGTGPGGVTGTGGSSASGSAQPDAAMAAGTGGAPQGSGGSTSDAGQPASGGRVGTGGLAEGGDAGDTGRGSGGTTAGSQSSTGGRTGTGGIASSGGRSGSGGGAGGAQSAGGTPAASGGSGGGVDASASGAGGAGGGNGSPPVPSAGCGNMTPPASDRYTIDVSGTSREYILKVPDGYDPNHPYRLILGFHGAQYDDNWVATGKPTNGGVTLSGPYFGIESEANGSAIFVAPQAHPTWSSSDLAFVDAMVARFESQLCIDTSRIFSVGFSMGAIMTITLGCNRSDVFRGIAPMSGSLPSPCPTGQHIAYWASHGTNDTTIPIAQGQAARDEFAKRNHCGTQTSDPDTNNCVTYQGCDQGYPVIWCTFPGVHEPAPFAGPEIWQFLSPL